MRIEGISNRGVCFILIVALALITTLMMYLPVENIPLDQTDNETLTEVPAISDLSDSNLGINSLTFKWSKPPDSAQIASYKIYLDEILIDTVNGSSNMYTVTGLRAGKCYNFHVEACNASGKCNIGGPGAGARTLTVQQATEAIINKVESLTSSGILNKSQGESLKRNLAAIYQLDNMNATTTIMQLQIFIDNINSLIADGVIPKESGQTLIDATEEVIRNLL